eukprot:CAMPEP_0180772220 /NCGR_PEP_ID=MMETSP1038_2-20121128/42582_1 /TAXON_ID=632150 /ORGANISM="Azadinium spinosum, Strain 3D9" /LENGTH=106 /DNA_ID=CAMNT_0022807123 /DNA_START=38 /DNA_END=358 /DNA_ORIENTATION=+
MADMGSARTVGRNRKNRRQGSNAAMALAQSSDKPLEGWANLPHEEVDKPILNPYTKVPNGTAAEIDPFNPPPYRPPSNEELQFAIRHVLCGVSGFTGELHFTPFHG